MLAVVLDRIYKIFQVDMEVLSNLVNPVTTHCVVEVLVPFGSSMYFLSHA